MNEGAGPYRAMPRAELACGALRARAVEPADIEPIRQWRNSQMQLLRQSNPITAESQRRYFSARIWPGKAQTEPQEILLSCLEEGKLIGYGGLVHIVWEHRRAELSFLLSPDASQSQPAYDALFSDWIQMMLVLAFEDLGLRRLTTETYATRASHLPVLEASGFAHEGTLREHVVIDGKPCDAFLHGCLARQTGEIGGTR